MWAWPVLLCVSLVSGLALDSNTIRSSKESSTDRSHGNNQQTETNYNSQQPLCSADCAPPTTRSGCSNRAQRRKAPPPDQATPPAQDTPPNQEEVQHTDFNSTKAAEMAVCVRSWDCAVGLCCARYLTARRCVRVPLEGDVCSLRSKRRRNLGRCDCGAGLTCGRGAESGQVKGQGICVPRQRQRSTRHSGKKRRTAERSC